MTNQNLVSIETIGQAKKLIGKSYNLYVCNKQNEYYSNSKIISVEQIKNGEKDRDRGGNFYIHFEYDNGKKGKFFYPYKAFKLEILEEVSNQKNISSKEEIPNQKNISFEINSYNQALKIVGKWVTISHGKNVYHDLVTGIRKIGISHTGEDILEIQGPMNTYFLIPGENMTFELTDPERFKIKYYEPSLDLVGHPVQIYYDHSNIYSTEIICDLIKRTDGSFLMESYELDLDLNPIPHTKIIREMKDNNLDFVLIGDEMNLDFLWEKEFNEEEDEEDEENEENEENEEIMQIFDSFGSEKIPSLSHLVSKVISKV